MNDFSVRDFLKALEVLRHERDYPELATWIRLIRSKVSPECLNLELSLRSDCCPEYPYVCDANCTARKATHGAGSTTDGGTVDDLLKALEMLARKEGIPALSRYLHEVRTRVAPLSLKMPFDVAAPPLCPEWPYVCGTACATRHAHAQRAHGRGEGETTFADFLRALEALAAEYGYGEVTVYVASFRAWLQPDCLNLPFYLKKSCPEWPYICGTSCTATAREAGVALDPADDAR